MNSKQRALVQTSYDRLAVEYAGHITDELSGKPLDRQLLDRFADEVRGTGPACDLGCGPGHVARYLHDRGLEIQGIDLSPGMLEQARRLHPSIEFHLGDLFALDVVDGTFSGVVAFYSIVHIAADVLPSAFREMRRILRPGGRLLVAFHIGDDVVHPRELWGVPVALDWVFFQTDAVVRSLTSAGLIVTDVVEREPYEGVEHASQRAYVFATRPRGS
jgi:ubiquinone/menaquinone biosynthesis C-methylase UbiE